MLLAIDNIALDFELIRHTVTIECLDWRLEHIVVANNPEDFHCILQVDYQLQNPYIHHSLAEHQRTL